MASAANTCDEFSNCSREGYCGTGAQFCMWGLCNESKSFNSTSCWPAEGCANQVIEFDNSSDVISIANYNGDFNSYPFVSIFEPDNASIEDGKLVLSMTYDSAQKKGMGATVDATHNIQYGRVTARIKTAAVATGTVTAFIIRNDQIGDEIDFEWVGKDPKEVETNFFYHDILDYTNSKYFKLDYDSSDSYHDYTIDWSPEAIVWLVDGVALRTLKRDDTYDSKAKEYKYPAAAGRVGLSIWDGGNSGQEGTEEWAGTPTPWTSSTVYKMYVESLQIECNADTNTMAPTGGVSSIEANESDGASSIEANESDGASSIEANESDGASSIEANESDVVSIDSEKEEEEEENASSRVSTTLSEAPRDYSSGNSDSEFLEDGGSSDIEEVEDGSSSDTDAAESDNGSSTEYVDDSGSDSSEEGELGPISEPSPSIEVGYTPDLNSENSTESAESVDDASSTSISNPKCHVVTVVRRI
ncbi:putative glycosidase CRH2 [Coemansia sp. Benny D115]|nr:putative glycosidase CRH2 [Coemansia sp. Benny D115]